MDIRYAILGLLSWRPFSGYDLKRIISESDLFYWSGNNNQIYYSLVQLHQDGLVSQEVQPQENLPARKIYTITQRGQEQMHHWAAAEPELPEQHRNFLIQLAWAEPLSTTEVLKLLDQYEQEISVQMRMRQVRSPALAPSRSERERFLWDKINERMLVDYEHELAWVRDVGAGLVENFSEKDRKEK